MSGRAKISVVIPYFQRRPGILLRALETVFAQSIDDVEVIVVDDGSPSPASADLLELPPHHRSSIRIVERRNGGPGAARNTGLDNLSQDTQYVAFLDSDDLWKPGHLDAAIEALSRYDASIYLASIEGDEEFDYHHSIATLGQRHEVNDVDGQSQVFSTTDLTSLLLPDWGFVHLSCLVLTRALADTVRFDESLRLAAEDVLFLFDCSLGKTRTLLATAGGAVRGRGVNIFHSVTGSDRNFISQQYATLRSLVAIGKRVADRRDLVSAVEAHKGRARRQAIWASTAQIRSGNVKAVAVLARWVFSDPAIVSTAARLALAKVSIGTPAERHHH